MEYSCSQSFFESGRARSCIVSVKAYQGDTLPVLLGDTKLSRLAVFKCYFLLLFIIPSMEQVMSLMNKLLVFLIPVGVCFIGVWRLCGVCLEENQNI